MNNIIPITIGLVDISWCQDMSNYNELKQSMLNKYGCYYDGELKHE